MADNAEGLNLQWLFEIIEFQYACDLPKSW